MKLIEYIEALLSIIEDNPEHANLPIIYATDSEGNNYHPVDANGTPAHVENPEAHHVELIGYYDGSQESDTKLENVNAIIIN
jgi:hypothetical protein